MILSIPEHLLMAHLVFTCVHTLAKARKLTTPTRLHPFPFTYVVPSWWTSSLSTLFYLTFAHGHWTGLKWWTSLWRTSRSVWEQHWLVKNKHSASGTTIEVSVGIHITTMAVDQIHQSYRIQLWWCWLVIQTNMWRFARSHNKYR